MVESAAFFKGIFSKEGPYTCYIIKRFGILVAIRYQTNWDSGAYYDWHTRIKFKWNVIE